DRAMKENPYVTALLQDLVTATVRHFEHEDLLLRRIAAITSNEPFSPDALRFMSKSVLAEHIHDHAETLKELNLLVQSVQTDRRLPNNEICDRLKNWFIGHAIR